jgi:hypothetical protein
LGYEALGFVSARTNTCQSSILSLISWVSGGTSSWRQKHIVFSWPGPPGLQEIPLCFGLWSQVFHGCVDTGIRKALKLFSGGRPSVFKRSPSLLVRWVDAWGCVSGGCQRGRPPDGARCSRCAGLQRCKSFVEMCIVNCLSAEPVCVRGRGAATWGCHCDSPAPLYLTSGGWLSFGWLSCRQRTASTQLRCDGGVAARLLLPGARSGLPCPVCSPVVSGVSQCVCVCLFWPLVHRPSLLQPRPPAGSGVWFSLRGGVMEE